MIFLYEHTLSYFKPKVWSNVGYVRVCGRLLEPRVGRGTGVKTASGFLISSPSIYLLIWMWWVCACVCVFTAALVHRCVPVHAHVCAQTHGDLSLIPDGFLDCSPPWTHGGNISHWPRSSSFSKPGRLTCSEDFLSMLPRLGLQVAPYVGPGDLNSGPQVCIASPLPAEPSLQSHLNLFYANDQ